MKRFAIFALSILVLTQAYAFSQAEALSVSTNSDSYQAGDIIDISGSVSVSSDPLKAYDVAIKITAPNGNLVTVQQTTPSSDGSYSISITSGTSWKFEGVYAVTANYGEKSASTSFAFGISEAEAIEEVVEAAEEVAEVIEVAAGGLVCGSGTHEADGFCIPDGSDSFGLTYDSASANGLILTAAIAFGIAVAIIITLRLIGKAGGSR